MFKFSLGSFGAFPIFGDLVSWKQLVVERNEPNLGFWGKYTEYENLGLKGKYIVYLVYRVLLTVKCSGSVWGHLVHSQFSSDLIMLYLENNSHKAKWTKFSSSEASL